MSKEQLALLGGNPVIGRPLKPYNSIGEEELLAASEVIRGGVLSAYIGAPGDAFMGGPKVRALEAAAAGYFGVKHAVAVNSGTSGLIAAVGAIGLEPGDEVVTTPWTMAATATSILHWNGIPVFADIDPETFNIDPESVEKAVSPHTRAILAVDIFGQSADVGALRAIADRHNLKLICDTAQAPGARYQRGYAGTMADIGVFSLNYHKHVHCGEGGVLVTDDDRLATRMQLIRNHAEAVIQSDRPADLSNMLGYNFRLGEIEAAIALEQLKKLGAKVKSRQRAAEQLDLGLRGLRGLLTPVVAAGCTHTYYVYGITIDPVALGVSRARVLDALRAEGVPGLMAGYQNLHLLPLFRNRIAYGSQGFPWSSPYCRRDIRYGKGLCPVAEELHNDKFIALALCMYEYPSQDLDLVIEAFRKVWGQLGSLANKPQEGGV